MPKEGEAATPELACVALLEFGLGDATATREALGSAVVANPHVVDYLLDPESMPAGQPPSFALGSGEEAAYVAQSLAGLSRPRRVCSSGWLLGRRGVAPPAPGVAVPVADTTPPCNLAVILHGRMTASWQAPRTPAS
jgi:hypothetical protein